MTVAPSAAGSVVSAKVMAASAVPEFFTEKVDGFVAVTAVVLSRPRLHESR